MPPPLRPAAASPLSDRFDPLRFVLRLLDFAAALLSSRALSFPVLPFPDLFPDLTLDV